MELVEIGPSMDLVVRRHRLPNERLRKEAMKTSLDKPKRKVKNVRQDIVQGRVGKMYIPDQQLEGLPQSNNLKGLKRERREKKEGRRKKSKNSDDGE